MSITAMPSPATAAREPPPTACWCTWTPIASNVGPNGVRPRASAARPYNSRLAYVSVSRGRYYAQIYTNDAEKLGEELSRDVSKQSALETEHEMGWPDQGHATENAEHQSVSESHEHGQGYGMEH